MSRAATFFGKIPGRGDFVKGAGHPPLIGRLDGWASGAMELIADDPGWKAAYDQAAPIDFAFVGAGSGVSVVGHLRPSADASGRRFPFLAAAAVERGDTLMFRCAPCGLGEAWRALGRLAGAAVAGAPAAAGRTPSKPLTAAPISMRRSAATRWGPSCARPASMPSRPCSAPGRRPSPG